MSDTIPVVGVHAVWAPRLPIAGCHVSLLVGRDDSGSLWITPNVLKGTRVVVEGAETVDPYRMASGPFRGRKELYEALRHMAGSAHVVVEKGKVVVRMDRVRLNDDGEAGPGAGYTTTG